MKKTIASFTYKSEEMNFDLVEQVVPNIAISNIIDKNK